VAKALGSDVLGSDEDLDRVVAKALFRVGRLR
jgi:hypothetical protein